MEQTPTLAYNNIGSFTEEAPYFYDIISKSTAAPNNLEFNLKDLGIHIEGFHLEKVTKIIEDKASGKKITKETYKKLEITNGVMDLTDKEPNPEADNYLLKKGYEGNGTYNASDNDSFLRGIYCQIFEKNMDKGENNVNVVTKDATFEIMELNELYLKYSIGLDDYVEKRYNEMGNKIPEDLEDFLVDEDKDKGNKVYLKNGLEKYWKKSMKDRDMGKVLYSKQYDLIIKDLILEYPDAIRTFKDGEFITKPRCTRTEDEYLSAKTLGAKKTFFTLITNVLFTIGITHLYSNYNSNPKVSEPVKKEVGGVVDNASKVLSKVKASISDTVTEYSFSSNELEIEKGDSLFDKISELNDKNSVNINPNNVISGFKKEGLNVKLVQVGAIIKYDNGKYILTNGNKIYKYTPTESLFKNIK